LVTSLRIADVSGQTDSPMENRKEATIARMVILIWPGPL